MFMHIYTYICGIQTDAMNNDERRLLYKKYVPLTLLYGLKGLFKVLLWEGVGDRTETAIFWLPLLWSLALCLSRSLGLLNRRPRGPALCWMMAFFTASYRQLLWTPTHRGPRGPLRPGVALPTTSYQQLTSNWLTSVLTELYNSSTPTQSPTRSLEWHVWSSLSGNNCHAVHRSLSSGALVYECTMGILACPILLAKSTYEISPHKCHRNVSLPSSASLCNGKFCRVEGQNTTLSLTKPKDKIYKTKNDNIKKKSFHNYITLERWLIFFERRQVTLDMRSFLFFPLKVWGS